MPHKSTNALRPDETGTTLAIIGVAPFDTKHGFPKHGGNRNRKGRISTALPLDTALTAIAAAHRAAAIGLPFNRFVTVHWEHAGLTDAHAAKATSDLVKLASDWLRTKNVDRAWLWIRENDYGNQAKGSHVHILIHCPKSAPIGRMWRRWIRKVTGKPYRKGVVHSRTIGGNLNCHHVSPALYQANLAKMLAYVCKGVTPADAARLGIDHEPGGLIIGKRAAGAQIIWKKGGSLLSLSTRPQR